MKIRSALTLGTVLLGITLLSDMVMVPEQSFASRPSLHASGVPPSPRVQVLLPVVDQPDIRLEDRMMADEIIRLILPPHCRSVLKNFYVRYNPSKDRGLAGKNSAMIVGYVPKSERRALAIHEISHVFDLGCLTGNPSSGASAYKDGAEIIWNDDPSVEFYKISWTSAKTQKPGSKKTDFASTYAASTDCFEDLTEFAVRWVTQQRQLKEIAKKNPVIAAKIRWFETYMPIDPSVATGKDTWNGLTKPAWDATKLAYTWHTDMVFVAQK
jgi:hypothetical protein